MNIYICNLNQSITAAELMELFSPYGTVKSAKIINDHTTGRSRGFGFVEMPDDEAAKKAIADLHEAQYEGKVISVNEARPKTSNGYSNSGFNHSSNAYKPAKDKSW